jgi:outer membrane protein TolC
VGPLGELGDRVPLPQAAALQQMALDRQPELRTADLMVERAQAALAVADSDFKPDFALQGGYMLMPDSRDAWTAQVSVTWPKAPWSRGRVDARRSQAAADVEAARARRRAAENAVRLVVQQAYVRVTAAEARAELLRTSIIPQAQQALEVARAGYQTGRGEFLPLLDNQRVLLDTRLTYLTALTEREQALADLERAVGGELAGRAAVGLLSSSRER